MIREETNLAGCLIGNGIRVFAGRDEDILISDIYAFSIRHIFHVIRLRGAVPLNIENGKADFVAVSESVFIGDREVAVNPVPDLNPLADHPYRLSDGHRRVLMDGDIAVEIPDDLGCRGGREGSNEQRTETDPQKDQKRAGID